MGARVEIHAPGAPASVQPLTERLTVGCAAPAHIVLPAEPGLLAEHILLAPQGGECWVSVAEGSALPVSIEGQPFSSGHVPWGTELHVGRARLRLLRDGESTDVVAASSSSAPAQASASSEPAAAGKSGVSPVLPIALVVALGALASMFLLDDEPLTQAAPSAQPPALFSATATCDDGKRPAYRAQILAEEGAAMAERYPFSRPDGVEAAERFALSAACFRAAGREREARRSDAEGKDIRDRVDREFSTQRFTLNRALDSGDYATAERAARALVELTEHLPETDDYVRQVRYVARRVAQKARQAPLQEE